MMKTMQLLDKIVVGKQADKDGKIYDAPTKITSKELLITAIQQYPETMRGIQNVIAAVKILEKIEAAKDEIVFEDSEWMMVYRAVDAMTWGPLMVKFVEFFKEVSNVDKGL
jgi:hypothetical protein